MFYFQIKCKPMLSNQYFDEVSGAYAATYIDFKNLTGAYKLAEFFIQDSEWEIIDIIDYTAINYSDLTDLEEEDMDTFNEYGVFIKYVMFDQ